MLLVLFCYNLRTFYSGEKGIFAGATRVLKKVQSAANCYQTTFVVMTSFFKGSTQCSLCFVFIWNQLIFSTYICNYSNKEHHHKQFFFLSPGSFHWQELFPIHYWCNCNTISVETHLQNFNKFKICFFLYRPHFFVENGKRTSATNIHQHTCWIL